MGKDMIASCGLQEMPVWGPIFQQAQVDIDRRSLRLERPDGVFSKPTAPCATTHIPWGDQKVQV